MERHTFDQSLGPGLQVAPTPAAAAAPVSVARRLQIRVLRFDSQRPDVAPHWQTYALEGESWFGFPAVRPLLGAGKDEILLIPVTGHTRGHTAIAVRSEGKWLLHCGDAYFGYVAGCSGAAGRIWSICSSYTTYGRWAP